MRRDRAAGADQRREVGLVGNVHGRRHGDEDEIGLAQCERVARVFGLHGERHFGIGDFARRIGAGAALGDLVGDDIEADGARAAAELDHQRQADIAQAENGDDG